jgi:magnesium chelatase family protein
MWARRLTTILPEMTLPAALATTRIPHVAGRTGDRTACVTTRPCRAPHHTISEVGLIGGGQVLLPGDVSRAHHGVLFLDERPACRRHVLEVLRQPLGRVWYTYNLAGDLDLTELATLAALATYMKPTTGRAT